MLIAHRLIAAATAALLLAAPAAANTIAVPAGGTGATGILTDLGYFQAGEYLIAATGSTSLLGNGDGMALPDGSPASPVADPRYLDFNSSGSFIDHGMFGVAGANARIGALIGSFSATPRAPADWFLIGNLTTVRLAAAGHAYASVNDTYYDNNLGAFSVTITAVPEPLQYPMLCSGLVLLAWLSRARRNDCDGPSAAAR